MKTSLDSKAVKLEQSTQDVKNLEMQVVELKASADQSLAEANQLQVVIEHQKKEMALVINMQLARDEEVKQVIGGLEKKVSELSTELEIITKVKVKCEGENVKLNEKLSHSTKACDEILDQLKDKTDLVETQQIRIENLYSQLTMANASYELLSKEKTSGETALEEQIKDLQGEVNQVNEELDQLKGVMAAYQAEHDLEVQTLTEEHQESKNKVVAESELWHKQLLADVKAEHGQMTLLMEKEHKKAKSDVEAHHLHELHELEAKAEEKEAQVRELSEELLKKTARIVEQDRLLAERQELLDQVEVLLSEKNGEKEKLLKSLSEKDQSLVAAKEEQEQTLEEVRREISLKEEEFQARMEEKDRMTSEMRGKHEELKKRFTEDIKVAENTEAELKDIVVDMNKRIEELEQSLEDQDHTYKANIAELEQSLEDQD